MSLQSIAQLFNRAGVLWPQADDRRGKGLAFAIVAEMDRLGALRDLYADHRERLDAELASRVRGAGPDVVLGRMGHSRIEFFFRAADRAEGEARLEAVAASLEAEIRLDGQTFELPLTLGVACTEAATSAPERMVEGAEHALAHARAQHLKLAFYDEEARAARADRVSLLRDLRAALPTDAVYLAYQPKLDARTGEIASAEALIRWRCPKRGMVSPDDFIGLAEQTGEIRHLTERVLERAIQEQDVLSEAGVRLPIYVNVSGALFCDRRFTEWMLQRLRGVAGVIGLEITETAVITDPEYAIAQMRAFADAGVPLAIDDYGSGLSSLSYLKQLPADELKIDKAFVSGLSDSQRDPLIVRSTIDLAHALEMKVTAEGVDDPAARALLSVMGCDLLQGYGISRPLPLPELLEFMRAHDPQKSKLDKASAFRAIAAQS